MRVKEKSGLALIFGQVSVDYPSGVYQIRVRDTWGLRAKAEGKREYESALMCRVLKSG
jgi:hypothetical protein